MEFDYNVSIFTKSIQIWCSTIISFYLFIYLSTFLLNLVFVLIIYFSYLRKFIPDNHLKVLRLYIILMDNRGDFRRNLYTPVGSTVCYWTDKLFGGGKSRWYQLSWRDASWYNVQKNWQASYACKAYATRWRVERNRIRCSRILLPSIHSVRQMQEYPLIVSIDKEKSLIKREKKQWFSVQKKERAKLICKYNVWDNESNLSMIFCW